jgi:hypothetical protein
MNQEQDDQIYPVINVEEKIGKTVGRRKLTSPLILQEIGRQIFKRSGFRMCDPGVYCFNSHEEADEWMMKMTIKRAQKADQS